MRLPSRSQQALYAALMIAVSMVLAATPAAAHESGNHGTIKVHDEETANPATRNEPHVDCEDFWIQGFKMADSSGHLVIYSWPPTGNKSEVMNEEWNAISHDHEGAGGFGFNAGPFHLDAGHYRVEVFLDAGHNGNRDHFAKAKMFWVEPCEAPPLPCPTNLKVTAVANGDVELNWKPVKDSTGSNIYRAEGDGDFEWIASVGEDVKTYTDSTTKLGTTYTYQLSALFGNRESFDCATVEVTTIPDLPTTVAASLAIVGGLVAYAGFSRRKKT